MSTLRAFLCGAGLVGVAVLIACGSKAGPVPGPERARETTSPEPTPAAEMSADPHAGHEGAEPTPSAQPPAASTPPDAATVKADLLAAELATFEAAKLVFDKNCARCHQAGGAKAKPKMLKHFDITTYPFGGHHADEASKTVRKVLGIGGGKPTMPADKKGAVQGDDLALIAAWAEAFDKAHEGGAHDDRGHKVHGAGHKH